MATTMETTSALEQEDNNQRPIIFEDSTHGFLYSESNIWEKALSIYIILLQYILYITFIVIGISEIKDNTTSIDIDSHKCDDVTEGDYTDEEIIDLLVCGSIDKGNQFYITTVFMSVIVLGKFLLFDMIETVRGFKINFIASILIFIEAVLAFIAGYAFIYDGLQTSTIDILMGAVAVIFVHDIDEVVRKSVNKLPKNWCRFVLPFSMIFVCLGIGWMLSVIFEDIQESQYDSAE